MPIYEYECGSCGQITELMQKMSDPGPEVCGACHKGPMVKIMSRTGFILKGSGWYVTDFKDSKKKSPASPSAGPEADAPPPAESKAAEPSAPAKETKSEGATPPPSSAPSAPAPK